MENRKVIMITGEPYVPMAQETSLDVVNEGRWLGGYDDDHILFPGVVHFVWAWQDFWEENGWLIKALCRIMADRAKEAFWKKAQVLLTWLDDAAMALTLDIIPAVTEGAARAFRAVRDSRAVKKAKEAWEWRKELLKGSID